MYSTRSVYLLILLLLVTPVFALDCQYTETTTNTSLVSKIFYNKEREVGDPLLFENFHSVNNVGTCTAIPDFTIRNPNTFALQINLTFQSFQPQTGANFWNNKIILLDKLATVIVNGSCIDSGDTQISNVTYSIVFPESFSIEEYYKKVNVTICQKCGEDICLNDGLSCTSGSQCGSRICNIAGICGTRNSSFVVPCPDGLLNCNDQRCVRPSTKSVGEAYSCEWECNSTVGKNGVCDCPNGLTRNGGGCIDLAAKNMSTYSYVILIFGIGVFFVWLTYNFWVTNMAGQSAKRILKTAEEIGNQKIKDAAEEAERIINHTENKISALEKKIKQRQNVLNTLEKNRKQTESDRKRIEEENNEIKKLNDEKKILLNQRLEEIKEGTKKLDVAINERVEHYQKQYPSHKLVFDGAYIKFENGEYLHRWIYRKKKLNGDRIPEGYVIHHIDRDKLNNEIENLEMMTKEEHEKEHSKDKL